MTFPGFTAEISVSRLTGRFRATAPVAAISPRGIQPAAISTCARLGRAAWDAYDAGDYNRVQYIDFVMTLVGCFD